MTQLLNRVQPGDLIKADQWNLLIDTVNSLLQAGPANGMTLGAVFPEGTAADPIRIGTPLQITGQNLGYSLGLASVTFEAPSGAVTVSRDQMLAGSADTRLLMIVPPIAGVSAAGTTMTLRVSNGIANTARSVLVAPVVIPLIGDMFVTLRTDATPNPNPNPLSANQEAKFLLRLQAATNLAATFNLGVEIPDASVAIPPDFVNSIVFLDQSGAVIANKRVEMGKSEVRNITARIPQIPAAFNNQTFTLKVAAEAGGVRGEFTRAFTVGTLVPELDPSIQVLREAKPLVLDADDNIDNDPTHAQLVGNTISLKPGLQMIVMFNLTLNPPAELTPPVDYQLTVLAKEGTTLNGWSPRLVSTPSTIAGPVTERPVKISVTPSATASSSGTVVFRISRAGAAKNWFQEFQVRRI